MLSPEGAFSNPALSLFVYELKGLTFISSSTTMARCSASKATGNPETNFMAAGEMSPQALYG